MLKHFGRVFLAGVENATSFNVINAQSGICLEFYQILIYIFNVTIDNQILVFDEHSFRFLSSPLRIVNSLNDKGIKVSHSLENLLIESS